MEICCTGALGMICLAALRLGSVVQLAADATSGTSALAPFRSDWPGLELILLSAPERDITIHMPQRTSKTWLVRLTANKNLLLFQIRVTCFVRYTV